VARAGVGAAQTPQVFRAEALRRALEVDDATLAAATDDASLVEATGGTVRLVEAPVGNLKVTTEADLARAAAALC
jgi:2-C-methyl-D-erythritol 4-phosphate cytidylyltransferase